MASMTAASFRAAVVLAAVIFLGGCATFSMTPKVDVAEPLTALPSPPPQAPITNGSIFQAAQYRPLFEDHRARLVGDTITVQIVEKVSASQKSTSTVDKSGKVDAAVSALPFLSPNSFSRASAAGSSTNSFSGKGSTESTNDFSGTITAVVTGVLPNG
ncbi:MAG TPA: flagellar basal body L-ring protein FlgH, partial [Burkholderiaceae bacterium]|nr:flagellar basal body L-ring protein FlgH [Burkholderiaceae bacterium]